MDRYEIELRSAAANAFDLAEARDHRALLRDALQTLLEAAERGYITEGDCNQARAALKEVQ